MSEDRPENAPETLTEDAARRVVAKAIRLQAKDGDIRVADLRQAVRELGVSAVHFDAALAEEKLPATRTTLSSLRTNVSVGVLGGLLTVGSFLMPHVAGLPLRWLILGGLTMWSGALAWRHRAHSFRFHTANGAVWIGHALASALVAPLVGFQLPTSDWTLMAAVLWSFTSMTGIMMHRIEASSINTDASRPSLGQQAKNVAARMFRWIAERLEDHTRYSRLLRVPTVRLISVYRSGA